MESINSNTSNNQSKSSEQDCFNYLEENMPVINLLNDSGFNFSSIANSPNNNISMDNQNDPRNNSEVEFFSHEYNIAPREAQTPVMYLNVTQNKNNSQNEDNRNDREKKNTPPISDFSGSETKISSVNANKTIQVIPLSIPVPTIQNIVSTADFECSLNLKQIALQTQNSSYNPKRFSGLIIRLKEPKTTALLFSTGKIVCLGAKTEEQSKMACKKYGKMLKSLGYKVKFSNFKIQNIVSSCNLKFKIPLGQLYIHMIKNKLRADYESEVFPGLIYRYIIMNNNEDEDVKNANIVFLIFASGNIVIAGAKHRNQIYDSFKNVYPVLKQFQKDENTSKIKK